MIPKIKLINEKEIPQMFLGTVPFSMVEDYKFKHWKQISIIDKALNKGLGIDTAAAYFNHREVAYGLKLERRERKDFFVTSKLYNTQQDNKLFDHYRDICNELGLDKVDLLLLHWPQTSTYIDAWKRMEQLYYEGKVGSIGIANLQPRHIEEMKKEGCMMPHVTQVERHPFYQQKELEKCCIEQKIQIQSYSPLARMNKITDNELFKELALKYNKTIPQVVLRWHIDIGSIPVARTIRSQKMKENIDIFDFELKKEDIDRISELDCGYKIYDPRIYARYY